MRRKLALLTTIILALMVLGGCEPADQASREERAEAIGVQQQLIQNQPIPTDIQASLERHNIIRRSYWINGMRERAMSLPNPVADPPLGYVILFAPNGGVIGRFVVEGKVTSLNYSLVPYSEYWERNVGGSAGGRNRWIANPGGVY